MIDIRPAKPSDAAALAALRWEFRAGRGDPAVESRDAFIARCTTWMARELGDDGAWRAWLAEEDGEVVGQVWLHTIQKVPNPIAEPERHAYLSNLYVRPSARGGVGTRLLDTVLAHTAANGVDSVVLWPSARSRSLYLRHGFTPDGAVLERTSTAR
jgi:GNAT superfamily N-acetyltransferase